MFLQANPGPLQLHPSRARPRSPQVQPSLVSLPHPGSDPWCLLQIWVRSHYLWSGSLCVVQLPPCRLLCSQKLLQMTVWLQWVGSGSWDQETFTNQKNKCEPFTVFTARSHVHTGNVPPREPSLLMIHPM